MQQVQAAGGISYATKQMNHFKEQALNVLHTFPDSDTRRGLEDMVLFVTDRKY
jgi:octaprenyl-diphosphate synthase